MAIRPIPFWFYLNISVVDIYYLYPFKINIVSFEMSGFEVKICLK